MNKLLGQDKVQWYKKMKIGYGLLFVGFTLLTIFANASELKAVPWRMFSAQTDNMKVEAQINEFGNFSSLAITTPYGVYKMSEAELGQLSGPEVTSFEAVEFPGIKHTEYHLQFYHRGQNYQKNIAECSGSGGNLDSDYVRIKVRVGNKVEIKPFLSNCERSWP